MARFTFLIIALFIGSCGGDDRPSGTDGGLRIDSGGGVDAGPGTDAGPGVDAAPGTDAGPETDAGADTDAGMDTDAGAADGGMMCVPTGGNGCADGPPCCEGAMCCAGIPLPEEGRCLATTTCPISDRNVKHGFAPVDAEAVLETVGQIPISTWSYDFEAEGVRHMGPMAQDFHAAFGLGTDDRHIPVIDSSGVSLAAIQALRERTERLADENTRLRTENATLESRLDALDRRLGALERR